MYVMPGHTNSTVGPEIAAGLGGGDGHGESPGAPAGLAPKDATTDRTTGHAWRSRWPLVEPLGLVMSVEHRAHLRRGASDSEHEAPLPSLPSGAESAVRCSPLFCSPDVGSHL